MKLRSLDEHRAATLMAILQVTIIIAGTLCVVAATKEWDDWSLRPLPAFIRVLRGAGLLLLVVPAVWFAGTLWRGARSCSTIEAWLWKLSGVAIFLLLLWIYSAAILHPFMPIITPIQPLSSQLRGLLETTAAWT